MLRARATYYALTAAIAVLMALPAAASDGGDEEGDLSDGRVVVPYAWEVVAQRSHDIEAFTQGLELDADGRLFESTGIYGSSTLREVDRVSGQVLRHLDMPIDHFGEGITLVGDRIVGLTWLNGVAMAWDRDTFEPLASFRYDGEGWGLCYDGERLVMSDGSDMLTFRDPETFEVTGSVTVTLGGEPLEDLNELECVGSSVWANVYWTDTIVEIDAGSGEVIGRLDLVGIIEPHPRSRASRNVLNGIAYDREAGTFLVTGKRWPALFEIQLSPAPGR